METPFKETTHANKTCHLLVKFIISVVGTLFYEDDWSNGDEILNLECEVGEFFISNIGGGNVSIR